MAGDLDLIEYPGELIARADADMYSGKNRRVVEQPVMEIPNRQNHPEGVMPRHPFFVEDHVEANPRGSESCA
jgi:hypothetical protein